MKAEAARSRQAVLFGMNVSLTGLSAKVGLPTILSISDFNIPGFTAVKAALIRPVAARLLMALRASSAMATRMTETAAATSERLTTV